MGCSNQAGIWGTGTTTHPSRGSRLANTQRRAMVGNHGELLGMTEGGHDFLSDLNDPATLAAGLTA